MLQYVASPHEECNGRGREWVMRYSFRILDNGRDISNVGLLREQRNEMEMKLYFK